MTYDYYYLLLLLWTNHLYYLNYWVSLGWFYLLDIPCDYSHISPLCGVAQTPDCGLLSFIIFLRGVTQTLVWSRYFLSFGFREDYRPTSSLYFQCIHILFRLHFCRNTHMHSCWHLLYLKSELSCEYIQSTHLACWFGQMWTKAISWMKSSIASPTPRGVPVSLLRSWSWSVL